MRDYLRRTEGNPARGVIIPAHMSLTTGTKIGPYEIGALLGAGGMGEVFRARDTRLGRDVALKMLPPQFAPDADRLHRFEQEARAVAALNHPNILAVFDIGEHNGSPYLVSELLEGETLRATIDRGALPQRKALEYGVQIAQGLAAAHEKGIVHRDLKPENVFVTKDGRVKILDFGLAKLAQKPGDANSELDGVTLTHSHTTAGVVMGTASYMSPEQVRGQAVDARTDIFAFGAVLYEMLSGTRAFRRDTTPETMTAVLKEDPPELSSGAHAVSPPVDRIVRRCLEKNPEQRFQSARDLSFALSALSGSDSNATIQLVREKRVTPMALWIGFALAIAAAAGLTWFLARRPIDATQMQFAIPVTGEVSHIALSRDGTMLAFVSLDEDTGLPLLYVQHVGSPNATLIPGTEGASYPFWSPDDAYVAFFANGKLQKVAATGGVPQALTNVMAARGGNWGSGDTILYSPDAGSSIWRVNADGTNAKAVTDLTIDPTIQTHRWAQLLPDGKHFLFLEAEFGITNPDQSGIFYGSLDGQKPRLVVHCHSSFGYGRGHLYYADDESRLVSAAFDPSTGTIVGAPQPIANSVARSPSTYWAELSVADNGTVMYYTGGGGALSALTWFDRSGKELGRIGEPHVMANPTISPDGNRVVVDISNPQTNSVDIWIESTTGSANTRLTFDVTEDVTAVWSRDERILAYRSAAPTVGIVTKLVSGLEGAKQLALFPASEDILPNSWSLDGKQLLCSHQTASGSHLWLISWDTKKQAPFLGGSGSQTNGMISPDGKWVAYASNEMGNWEVYVATFPGGQGKWQVSRGGGREPRWRGDSKEIFYLDPKGMLTSVPVNGGTDFSTGTPTPLFQVHGRAQISSTDIFTYDVTKDGKRFLVNRYVKREHIQPLTIVLNASADATK
jgi:Tol biopolymer transport system component